MSFYIINPVNQEPIKFKRGEYCDLEASSNCWIEPMSTCIIPHQVTVAFDPFKDVVWLARIPGEFIRQTLFIDSGPIDPGMIQTAVFNFGIQRTRIERGMCVSRLVAL